jgi:hypothetical protein
MLGQVHRHGSLLDQKSNKVSPLAESAFRL